MYILPLSIIKIITALSPASVQKFCWITVSDFICLRENLCTIDFPCHHDLILIFDADQGIYQNLYILLQSISTVFSRLSIVIGMGYVAYTMDCWKPLSILNAYCPQAWKTLCVTHAACMQTSASRAKHLLPQCAVGGSQKLTRKRIDRLILPAIPATWQPYVSARQNHFRLNAITSLPIFGRVYIYI